MTKRTSMLSCDYGHRADVPIAEARLHLDLPWYDTQHLWKMSMGMLLGHELSFSARSIKDDLTAATP